MFNRKHLRLWKLGVYKNWSAVLKPRCHFKRPRMKETWKLLNVFVMVCSWDRHHSWSHGEILRLKPFPLTLPSMGRLLFVVLSHIRRHLSAGMEPRLLWCRYKLVFASSRNRGFHNFVWILQERVVVALPRRLHRSRLGTVSFCDLWIWRYLSVHR